MIKVVRIRETVNFYLGSLSSRMKYNIYYMEIMNFMTYTHA